MKKRGLKVKTSRVERKERGPRAKTSRGTAAPPGPSLSTRDRRRGALVTRLAPHPHIATSHLPAPCITSGVTRYLCFQEGGSTGSGGSRAPAPARRRPSERVGPPAAHVRPSSASAERWRIGRSGSRDREGDVWQTRARLPPLRALHAAPRVARAASTRRGRHGGDGVRRRGPPARATCPRRKATTVGSWAGGPLSGAKRF